MDSGSMWIAFISTFAGWFLHAIYSWARTKDISKSGWNAIAAEIAHCCAHADEFMHRGIGSPQYRLPTTVYQMILSTLINSGLITFDEASQLSRYYSLVDDLNRGLENANHLLLIDNTDLLEKLHRRNLSKAEAITKYYESDITGWLSKKIK